MNHFFKLIWNAKVDAVVPVPEGKAGGARHGRGVRRRMRRLAHKLGMATGVIVIVNPALSFALPSGVQVAAGSATVSQSANAMTVVQGTQKAILNWQHFNIGTGQSVVFKQPSTSAIALNRVTGTDASTIYGSLSANGQVFLVNPNGVYFAPGARVNVGGIAASTLGITDQNFLSGNYHFSGSSTASVVNDGKITSANGGYVAFIGNKVDNEGQIATPGGTTALGAGGAVDMSLAGNQLLQFQVSAAALDAAVKNGGAVVAQDGSVILSAQAKNALLQTVVNNTGEIHAQGVRNSGGTIQLLGGDTGTTSVSGVVDASAPNGNGGTVVATGAHVVVKSGARISATGAQGGGTIAIGGGVHGGGGIAQAVTTKVEAGATIDASATVNGSGGQISAWSDTTNINSITDAYGTFLVTGGMLGGNGGLIETSGHQLSVDGIHVDASAAMGAGGTWLLDPASITISSGTTSGLTTTNSGTTTTISSTLTGGSVSDISAATINSVLDSGQNVTVTTGGNSGGYLSDIIVNSPITKSAGSASTLTLEAADSIIVNSPITNTSTAGGLNVNLYASSDNGTATTTGAILLNSNISTGGGNLTFGQGQTTTVNGVANTLVGGDVYVGSPAALSLTTAGGDVNIHGDLIIAVQNATGMSIDTRSGSTNGGNVTIDGLIDSGNSYSLNSTSMMWATALAKVKTGTGSAVGDTYLATVTSRLQNSVASYTAHYRASWLGAERLVGSNATTAYATWYWVSGPLGLAANPSSPTGLGTAFFTQNGTATQNGNGGSAINGAYINWNNGEPNNYSGTSLSPGGLREQSMQFVGTAGQWNDLPSNGNSLPSVVETNLAPSNLTIDAGNGSVTFKGDIGKNQPVNVLGINAGTINLPKDPVMNTTGSTSLNGTTTVGGTTTNVLTITGGSATDSYGDTVTTPSISYSGFVNGDTASTALSTQPTVSTTATTGSSVGIYAVSVSGAVVASGKNYTIIYNNGSITIDPRTLTYLPTAVSLNYGDTIPTLSGTISGTFASGDTAASIYSGTATYSTTATSTSNVGTYDITGSGLTLLTSNYQLAQGGSGKLTISPKQLTVSIKGTPTKTYDGSTAAVLTASNFSLSGFASGQGASVTQTSGYYASADASTSDTVTATLAASDFSASSGTSLSNYSLPTSASGTGQINPKKLSVSITGTPTKTYDGSTAATLTASDFSLSGFVSGQGASVTQTSGNYASADASTSDTVTATLATSDFSASSGTLLSNYSLPISVSGTGKINPKQLTASITGTPTKTYDGSTAADLTGTTLSLSGFVTGQSGSASGAASNAAYATANAGTGIAISAGMSNVSLSMSTGKASNYTLPAQATGAGDITRAQLFVTAKNITKTYDGTTFYGGNGVTYSGFVNGESNSVVGGALSYGGSAQGTRNAGTYAISPSGLSAQNYSFIYIDGTLKVNPATLSVSGQTVANKVYDGTTTASLSGGSLVGVIGTDAVTLGQAGSFATKNVGRGLTVTAADTLSGADAGNYSLTQPTGLSADVTPATLSVSGQTVANKVYDGTTTASLSGGSLVGVIGTDAVTLGQAGSFATKNVGKGLTVTAADTLSGADAGNYSLTQPTGLSADVTPATLSGAIILSPSKVYDGTKGVQLASSNFSLSGFVPGEGATVGAVTGTFADPNAGTHGVSATLSASDFTGTGGTLLSNYSLPISGAVSGTGFITPRSITASIPGAPSKTYDGTTSAPLLAGAVQLAGLVPGQSISVGPLIGKYSSAGPGNGLDVTFTLSPSDFLAGAGTLLANYALPDSGPITASGVGTVVALPSAPMEQGQVNFSSQNAATPTVGPTTSVTLTTLQPQSSGGTCVNVSTFSTTGTTTTGVPQNCSN